MKKLDKREVRAWQKFDKVHIELLEAGKELLSEKPISSLTLNGLSKYTDISKTSIYNHFNSSTEQFYYDLIVYLRNTMLDEFTKNAPSNPKEKIKFLFVIYLKLMKDNEVLCLNVYAQYFIVNRKARYKLFKNQVVTSLLKEIGIDDEETVRKISINFAMLLNRFFTYNLPNIEFSTLEKDFFQKLDNIINS
jgi:AcrR family transcriptional regulator